MLIYTTITANDFQKLSITRYIIGCKGSYKLDDFPLRRLLSQPGHLSQEMRGQIYSQLFLQMSLGSTLPFQALPSYSSSIY